ncbi:hypothetical protein C8F04DRAFT_1291632 [Mycena alexandri]|uniref:Uncharacterized protein n=1 Tax=Mycena alexandri TaxID=1745969 RepID=A0AAD6SL84_9AGAR|nr:hypothetical protein C8F04DRAFT_1291632 [Mycena alexandri]
MPLLPRHVLFAGNSLIPNPVLTPNNFHRADEPVPVLVLPRPVPLPWDPYYFMPTEYSTAEKSLPGETFYGVVRSGLALVCAREYPWIDLARAHISEIAWGAHPPDELDEREDVLDLLPPDQLVFLMMLVEICHLEPDFTGFVEPAIADFVNADTEVLSNADAMRVEPRMWRRCASSPHTGDYRVLRGEGHGGSVRGLGIASARIEPALAPALSQRTNLLRARRLSANANTPRCIKSSRLSSEKESTRGTYRTPIVLLRVLTMSNSGPHTGRAAHTEVRRSLHRLPSSTRTGACGCVLHALPLHLSTSPLPSLSIPTRTLLYSHSRRVHRPGARHLPRPALAYAAA